MFTFQNKEGKIKQEKCSLEHFIWAGVTKVFSSLCFGFIVSPVSPVTKK